MRRFSETPPTWTNEFLETSRRQYVLFRISLNFLIGSYGICGGTLLNCDVWL
ncbi:MAG: hypothetical protein LBP59_13230 [Planctomycetaceae bacterium]|nr:hypothetical protein [Planctomycetaceae bacterium]